MIVYFYKPAPLEGSAAWLEIRTDWRNLRDIYDSPKKANTDDVVRALRDVNETSKKIIDDPALLKAFRRMFKDDYLTLYRRLRDNKYSIKTSGKTSDVLLEGSAHQLAARMEGKS